MEPLPQGPTRQGLSQFDNLLADAGVLDKFSSLPNTPGVTSLLQRTDQLLNWLSPTTVAHGRRMAVFEFARSVIQDCFGPGARTVLIGSCALKTYLPDADIDMSVFVPRSSDRSTDPVAALTAHICKVMQKQQFHSVTCIRADTCVIKCVVDNMNVDITFGQENAVASLELFERFDASYIGQNHILKKSILLLKAWFLHDAGRAAGDNRQGNVVTNGRGRGGHAPIYGAKDGGLCTYALNTMVTCLLNTHDIRHPLQAFILFFKVFADFDWDRYYVTLFGFVPLRSKNPMQFLGGSPNKASPGQSLNLKMGVQQVACFPDHVIRSINIQDPLSASNNIGRSVSRASAKRLRLALKHGRHNLCVALCRSVNLADIPSMIQIYDSIFASSLSQFGRGDGWRPDLLDHPMQKWRGRSSHSIPHANAFDMTSMNLINSIRSELRVFLDSSSDASRSKSRTPPPQSSQLKRSDTSNDSEGSCGGSTSTSSTGAKDSDIETDEDPSSRLPPPSVVDVKVAAEVAETARKMRKRLKSESRSSDEAKEPVAASQFVGEPDQVARTMKPDVASQDHGPTPTSHKHSDHSTQTPDSSAVKQERTSAVDEDKMVNQQSTPSTKGVSIWTAVCAFVLGGATFAVTSWMTSPQFHGLGRDPRPDTLSDAVPDSFAAEVFDDNGSSQHADHHVVSETGDSPQQATLPEVTIAEPLQDNSNSISQDPSSGVVVSPSDFEVVPDFAAKHIAASAGEPIVALRHAPFYFYDFGAGSDADQQCVSDTGATGELSCVGDGQLRRKPKLVTSMAVVDPGSTLTLSIASDSIQACPGGPGKQMIQSILWYVGDTLVQRSNRTFVTLRNIGPSRPKDAAFAQVNDQDVFLDSDLEDSSSKVGALVTSYITCVDRQNLLQRTTYLGLRTRLKTSEKPILRNRVGRAAGRIGQQLVLEGPLWNGDPKKPASKLTEPYALQWSRNGVDLEGETGERVVIERFTPGHVGTYACIVQTPNGKTRWGEWIVQQAGSE